MHWIDMAQDRNQWRALVNTVMNLQVPQNIGTFLSSYKTGVSQEGLSSLELDKITVLSK
jgi:hypothetical protein